MVSDEKRIAPTRVARARLSRIFVVGGWVVTQTCSYVAAGPMRTDQERDGKRTGPTTYANTHLALDNLKASIHPWFPSRDCSAFRIRFSWLYVNDSGMNPIAFVLPWILNFGLGLSNDPQ